MIACKVCGKSFKPCNYCQKETSAFRWRAHCCSYECAKVFLRRAEKGVRTDSKEEEDEYDRIHKLDTK